MVSQPQRASAERPLKTRVEPEALTGPEHRQPDVHRLGRDHARPNTEAFSGGELVLEREFQRKVRVNRECLLRSGRAGDLSVRHGTLDRVEDAWEYFRSNVDSPTFVRFAAAVAALPGSRPHERRRKGQARAAEAARALDAAAVAALNQWDGAVTAERGSEAKG